MQRITTATFTEIITGTRQDRVGVFATVGVRRCLLGLSLYAKCAAEAFKRSAWLPGVLVRQSVLVPSYQCSHGNHALQPCWNPMRQMQPHGVAKVG